MHVMVMPEDGHDRETTLREGHPCQQTRPWGTRVCVSYSYFKFNMSWKSAVVVCSVIGGLAVATYPIIIAPYLNPRPWRDIQRVGREGIDRDKIQPAGMKAWTDPFASKKD